MGRSFYRRLRVGLSAGLSRAAKAKVFWLGLVSLMIWLEVLAPRVAVAQPNVVDAWLLKQATIRTWSAEFTQTRTLKTLTQPLTAQGRLWFEAPNQFRWELGNPPETIAVRQPDQLLVIYPELKRVERFPLSKERAGQWGGALALLEAGFPRDRTDLESKFHIVSQTQTGDLVDLRLQPSAASARRMLPRIDLVISSADLVLRATELEFADGSTLRNDFRDIQINPKVDESLFKSNIPSDYKVVEPLKR